jgi:hypothetical protein
MKNEEFGVPMNLIRCVSLLIALVVAVPAQTLPFFTEQQYKYLVGEISGDAAYEHLRFTTQFHKPDSGTPGLMKVALYVEAKAKDYGLADVKLIQSAHDKTQLVRVEGLIRGTSNEPEMLITAQLPAPKQDASDLANTLEIARALTKLINAGHLPKPKRSLRFWWVTESSNQRQYLGDDPAILYHVNQDMLQGLTRMQNVTYLPFSRWHWVNDVIETVVAFVVKSKELGVTFTHWPNDSIHTSDSDLTNIDRTQLQRNAFAVAAIGFTVANADEKSLPIIANEFYGRATIRLSEDFKVASTLLTTANESNKVERYKQSLNQIQEAIKREEMAINALPQITKAARPVMSEMRDGLKRTADGLILNLRSRYVTLFNESSPGQIPLSAKETELLSVVPQLIAGPKDWLTKRSQIKNIPKLNSLIAFEILNFVDGNRTGLDIYNAVSAESLRAGETYYGTVTPEMVGAYLQNLETAGLIKLLKE